MAGSTFNRLGNCHNVFQGDAKRVVAVCSAGLLRSPTIANTLHIQYGYNTRSAGVEEEFALICLDEVLLTWAEELVYATPEVFNRTKERYADKFRGWHDRNHIILSIPDSYWWNEPEMVALILKQYQDAMNIHKVINKC